jgi:hypothetical protein
MRLVREMVMVTCVFLMVATTRGVVRVRMDMRLVLMTMFVGMIVLVLMFRLLAVSFSGALDMDVELHPLDVCLGPSRDVKLVGFKSELAQFGFELAGSHSEIDHGSEKHIATYPAKDIEV